MYLHGIVAALGLLLASAPMFAFGQNEDLFVSRSEVLDYFGCKQNSSYSCHHLERNLKRDSTSCLADPEIVMDADLFLPESKSYKVTGKIKYVGFYPGKYGYFVKREGKTIYLRTWVYFENHSAFSDKEINELQIKMDKAAQRWSSYEAYSQFNLKFEVKITRQKNRAHVNGIDLVRKPTRGPYFHQWSTKWKVENLTHEFGHLFGLDDEYKNRPWNTGQDGCNPDSVMCYSWQGEPRDYHYYLMMRRVFCEI